VNLLLADQALVPPVLLALTRQKYRVRAASPETLLLVPVTPVMSRNTFEKLELRET
jgi:hypothetical protein